MSAVDINETTGKREGIDGLVIHNLELKWILSWIVGRMRCESFAQFVNVGRGCTIIQNLKLPLRFMRHLLPHLDVLLGEKRLNPGFSTVRSARSGTAMDSPSTTINVFLVLGSIGLLFHRK